MLSLQVATRIQYAQWAVFGLVNYFDKERFHKFVLQEDVPKAGSFIDDQSRQWATIAFANFALLAGAAQLRRDASIRKVLQYYMSGFISLIIFLIADGKHESNLNLIVWASVNAFFLIIVVYVWHSKAKNMNAQTDFGRTNALRLSYVIWSALVASNFSGKILDTFNDKTLSTDPAALAFRKLYGFFLVFFVGSLIAAAQVDADDQKKMLQYLIPAGLGFVIRSATLEYLPNWAMLWTQISVTSILITVITATIYGGTINKQLIRMYYIGMLILSVIGYFNPTLFLNLTTSNITSPDAGLVISGIYGFVGLLFAAIAQMDAACHRQALQYSLVGYLLKAAFYFRMSTVDLWNNMGLHFSTFWFFVILFVTYRDELGISSMCSSFKFGGGGGGHSPKSMKGAASGRSGTPSGMKKQKKK